MARSGALRVRPVIPCECRGRSGGTRRPAEPVDIIPIRVFGAPARIRSAGRSPTVPKSRYGRGQRERAMAKQFGVFTIPPDGLSGKKPEQYEASMLGMFHALDSLRTSHALFQGFRAIKREVLIFPYNGSLGTCNAYATDDWGMYRNKVS